MKSTGSSAQLNFQVLTASKLFFYLKRTSDHFECQIFQDDIEVSTVKGSYLSFIEFDGVRYWDVRDNLYLKVILLHNVANRT